MEFKEKLESARKELLDMSLRNPLTGTPVIERINIPASQSNTCDVQQYAVVSGLFNNDETLYNLSYFSKMIITIVNKESPVHVDEVLRRAISATGVKRAGSRIQETFKQAVNFALRTDEIKRKENFLWSKHMTIPVLRTREDLPAVYKKLEYIAPEEIYLAIKSVVKNNFGMLQNEIPYSACRLLGFSRTTDEMSNIVFELTERLMKNGELIKQGENLIING